MCHASMCNHFVVFQTALKVIFKGIFVKAWEEGAPLWKTAIEFNS